MKPSRNKKAQEIKHSSWVTFLIGSVSGVLITVTVLGVLIIYVVFDFAPPWKVTDPTSSHFSERNFSFSDYMAGRQLSEAMACLFPVGTQKAKVDSILVNYGGAKSHKYENKTPIRYHPNEYKYEKDAFRDQFFSWLLPNPSRNTQPSIHFTIKFDESNRVESAGFLKKKCRYKEKFR